MSTSGKTEDLGTNQVPAKASGDARPAWPEASSNTSAQPGAEENTIETVATNFMLHMQQVEKENQELLEDNRRLVEKLKAAAGEETTLAEENKRLKEEADDLSGQLLGIKDENSLLLKAIDDQKKQNQTLHKQFEKEKEKLESDNRAMRAAQVTLSKKTEVLEERLAKANEDMATYQRNMTDLEEDIRTMRSKVDKHKEDRTKSNDTQKEEMRKLREYNESLDTERNLLADELSRLRKELKAKEDEVSRFKRRLDGAEKDKDLHSKKLEQLRSDIAKSEVEVQKWKSKVKELEREIEQLRTKEKNQQSKQSEELRSEMAKSKTEIEIWKARVKELEAKNEELRAKSPSQLDLQQQVRELNAKVDHLRESLASSQDLLKSKDAHLEDLRQEVSELLGDKVLTQRELDRLRTSGKTNDGVISEKYQDMAGSHKKVLDDNKRLRSMVAKKAMEETNSTTRIAELQLELDSIRKKLETAQKRIEQFEKWMDEIFDDTGFEVVLKSNSTSGSVTSLPDMGYTSRSYGVLSRQSYPKAKKGKKITRFNPNSLSAYVHDKYGQ